MPNGISFDYLIPVKIILIYSACLMCLFVRQILLRGNNDALIERGEGEGEKDRYSKG